MTLKQFIDKHCKHEVTERVTRLMFLQALGGEDYNEKEDKQAKALYAPILDYESAARSAGWEFVDGEWWREVSGCPGHGNHFKTAQAAIERFGYTITIPYHIPVEFYAVSFAEHSEQTETLKKMAARVSATFEPHPGLAEWLIAEGERVLPLAEMMVWARVGKTTPLNLDRVMRKIWKEQS
jgi:hypothetical protein